ncbi:MAG: thioredoxin-disulfide reductase [Anaerolineae bacterium]
MRDIVIVGSGPAGLSAAVYAGRYLRHPLVVAGQAIGGQMVTIGEIENYPGFPDGSSGAELAGLMQRQAERFGAEFAYSSVTGVDFGGTPLRLQTDEGEIEAASVILAVGTSRRKMGVPGENELIGRGVSYCATCDAFFYRGKVVAVVGGGNSAVQEALELTRYCEKVYLIHRRDQLRADALLQERASTNERLEMVWNTIVDEIVGEQTVSGIKVRNVQTADTSTLAVSGVFVYIGSDPNTAFLKGAIQLDERGYLVVDPNGRTSVPGVFAAGDVRRGVLEQVVVAAGSGAIAAMTAEQFLEEAEGRGQPVRQRWSP